MNLVDGDFSWTKYCTMHYDTTIISTVHVSVWLKVAQAEEIHFQMQINSSRFNVLNCISSFSTFVKPFQNPSHSNEAVKFTFPNYAHFNPQHYYCFVLLLFFQTYSTNLHSYHLLTNQINYSIHYKFNISWTILYT